MITKYAKNPKFDNDTMDKTSYENNVGIIHKVARQVFNRSTSMRSSLSYDDIYQDACVVWVKAKRGFDPASGFSFSSYFVKSMFNELNRTLKKIGDNMDEAAESYSSDEGSGLSNAGMSLDQLVTDSVTSPESELVALENVEAFQNSLSSFARVVFGNYITPSKMIVDEFEMLQRKSKISEQLGLNRRFEREINLGFVSYFVAKIAGKSDFFARKIKKEIESKAKQHLVVH